MFKRSKYDTVLLIAVLAVVAIGVIMITSVGVPKSIKISAPDMKYPDCADAAVDCYLILKNHVARAGIGLVGMLVAWKMNYRYWKVLGPVLYIAAAGLLVFVLFAGSDNNTFATSWINVGGALPFVDSVQPSEIAKLGLIFYLSYFFAEKISVEKTQDLKEGFLKFGLIAGTIIGLIVLQPDIGSAMVLSIIAVVIYYLAGANWRHLAALMVLGMMLSILAYATTTHINNRVNAILNPEEACSYESGGESYCWQTRQANIAIGSGGFWGKGLTQGTQKYYWLPQAVDDFIFAASANELGFLRTAGLVLLYAVIAYRGFQIANHAPNKFSMLMAAGITTWISAQAFVNIMVNTALFPITGITLPFMSYGGSSMVMTLVGVGVLLNISKYTTNYAYTLDRRGNGRTHHPQSRYRSRYQRS
ncbi:MAG: putative peptidoglycan glycosyltransferase FtsW [Candidatus Gracilibacteria bacterium]|jgi:cell division protein FtsW